MLLVEYLNSTVYAHHPEVAPAPSLALISHFQFGERYLVELYSGKSFDIPDFEDMLSVMHDEFVVGRCMPSIEITTIVTGRATSAQVLRIRANRTAAKRQYGCDVCVDNVRRLVTMYNLTQNWDHFNQEFSGG